MAADSKRELFLIDGSSLVFRAFFALPESIATSKGQPTNAIFGFASMLVKIVSEYGVKPTLVVWDAGRSGREETYSEYKANRTPMPDELGVQIAPLKEAILAMGWPLIEIGGVEADDVIGTLTREAESAGMRIVISTGDKDMAQLVTPHVQLVNTMSNELLDGAGVEKKFGVKIIGSITMPLAVVCVILMQLLPSEVRPLVPALQSTWLHVHVTLAMLAYAACALSFALAMMFLIQDKMKTEIFLAATSAFTVGIYAAILTRFEGMGGFNVIAWDPENKSEVFLAKNVRLFVTIPDLGWLMLLVFAAAAAPLTLYILARVRKNDGFLLLANRAVIVAPAQVRAEHLHRAARAFDLGEDRKPLFVLVVARVARGAGERVHVVARDRPPRHDRISRSRPVALEVRRVHGRAVAERAGQVLGLVAFVVAPHLLQSKDVGIDATYKLEECRPQADHGASIRDAALHVQQQSDRHECAERGALERLRQHRVRAHGP